MNASVRVPSATDSIARNRSRIFFRIASCLLGVCLAWMAAISGRWREWAPPEVK
ncbi:MAG: hypothetical protein WD066_05030 [Planctomycetaceae bacterium]